MMTILIIMILVGGILAANIPWLIKQWGLISIGGIIAAHLSWAANHSFAWMIGHAVIGWMYVAYNIIFI